MGVQFSDRECTLRRNGQNPVKEEHKKYWCDGGCTNHDASGRERRAYGSFSGGNSIQRLSFSNAHTSNEAEYFALIALLSSLQKGAAPTIYCDSRLIVGQLMKRWKVKAENLKPLHTHARDLMRSTQARLKWVPRNEIVARLGH